MKFKKIIRKLKFKFEMLRIKYILKNRIMTLDMFLSHSRPTIHEISSTIHVLLCPEK